MDYYSKKASEILGEFGAAERGLAQEEAHQRLKQYGPNALPEPPRDSFFEALVRQFASPLIYVLVLAAIIIFFLGEFLDGAIILFVLVLNAFIGAIQEGRAENTLRALKNFVETRATVIRGGEEMTIPDYEVVPGDILLLQEGEKIPADARVLISRNLEIDEAALTGESLSVSKHAEVITGEKIPVTDQRNMVFRGTYIVAGNGEAVVVKTGGETIIGSISRQIAGINSEIPLKKDIRELSKFVVGTVVIASVCIFSLGVIVGKTAGEMFRTVVALAVSAIPEGLPVVLTVVLATGVFRMSKKNALVKRLQAVEALGQATVIAVDKTGTLTKNEIVIRNVFVGGKMFEIGGVGYEPKGEVVFNKSIIDPLNHEELLFAGKISALCANAKVTLLEEKNIWRVSGDPTEAAMLIFAEKIGFRKMELEKEWPLLAEIPFSYVNKYHATSHRALDKELVVISGAPEVILKLSDKEYVAREKSTHLTKERRDNLESVFLELSRKGKRVVAFAFAELPLKESEEYIGSMFDFQRVKDIVFGGFYGMEDALRVEAIKAIEEAEAAGARVVMITGDHRVTAEAIAREAGIHSLGRKIVTDEDVDRLSLGELAKLVGETSVFARITPEHKMKIIKAFQARGDIVAMTGDGVNDAPSLVAADLGVSMGRIGTEVAKEASDIVILDDNLGTIVSAIDEGRNILATIKKVVLYLFSTSFGETLVIIASLFLSLPLPVLPAQIIWLNLVTDSFLDVSLALEPKEDGLLKKGFRKTKHFVYGTMLRRIGLMGGVMMIGVLGIFIYYLAHTPIKALTASMTALAIFQWLNAWNCRSESKSIFGRGFFANRFLLLAMCVVVGLQLLAVYTPFLQNILHTVPLDLRDWLIIGGVALTIVVAEEVRKFAMSFMAQHTNFKFPKHFFRKVAPLSQID